MPHYIVTSDWHIQNTGPFARHIEGGLTTRAKFAFDFIEWLWDYCEKNKIEKILHCGDFFTQRGMISAPLYNRFWDLLTACPVPMIMIVGNHDRYKTDPSIHGMYVLADALDNITILDNQVTLDRNIRVAGCPPPLDLESQKFKFPLPFKSFGEGKHSLRTKRNILLIHENIIGAAYSSGKKADEGVSPQRLAEWMRENNFDICFCGDIHVPQEMTAWNPSIVIVGAPFQMDFGDRGQPRGIWNYDSDNNIVEFVRYEKGPMFFQVTDETWQEFASNSHSINHNTDFYQFKVKSLELYREIGELKKDWPNCEVQLVVDSSEEEFTVDNLYDANEIVPAYVRNEVEEVSEQIPLINRGLRYIEEALKEKGEQTL